MISVRPRVQGKFIFLGDEKLYIRGVTYGTFRPHADGHEYPDPGVVEQDFALMAANGLNAVRTYTLPPRWLLDAAQRHGLRVMVGLPLERYVGFLTDKKGAPDMEALVRTGVRSCAGHPAVLCYAIGNEIPASIVRWHGPRRIEHFLERLYRAAKAEDPHGLVTYVNYPSTEYLQLPFLDLACFNVYLESQESFEAYLARLQNIAGDRPLIMTEIGLDSLRNGEETQARALDWQIRAAFAGGCAGAFAYAWTDEWHRSGEDVDDWEFGLTRRDRQPKPALATVRDAYAEAPFPPDLPWPSISVVVCSYNGARTLRDCLEGLRKLEYPSFEVIVVDDGSTDGTAAMANEYGFRVISTAQRGLSNARNTGMEAATGEIVAYIDDDARPDPHWLTYLAATFLNTAHAGVGGPNLASLDDGLVAECIANVPGNPVHILLSDREAEHIPGCNMAVRKACLEAIGGFDPQYRVAGDDVDVCWRLQQRGWTLGFSPAAVVWHHRRNSARAYWKQQYGYGRAEALLEAKWPEKYNDAGHLTWAGRVYSKGLALMLGRAGRIYHGVWGSAPFQSLYRPASSVLASLPLMPEWYLVSAVLFVMSALGILWTPLLFVALPPLVLAMGASLVQAGLGAARASFASAPQSRITRLRLRILTACLYLIQPLARLRGRLRFGLTPWRQHRVLGASLPWPRTSAKWTEHGQASDKWLRTIETTLRADGAVVLRGGSYDRWDLEVKSGVLGAVRLLMAVEEHGSGRQLVRFRSWPRVSPGGFALTLLCSSLAFGAGLDRVQIVAAVFGLVSATLALRTLQECAAATAAVLRALGARAGPLRVVVDPAGRPAGRGASTGAGTGASSIRTPERSEPREA
ncbi:MAG TPA: glycosyltransferase [Anaerolineae bacterium]|nr:glycosyltransferase [Anaerolineae bacterium]